MAKMIELLKEKKLSPKKVTSTVNDIQRYSSITSIEKPSFDSEKSQKDHVVSLVQSAFDLLDRRAKVKIMIDQTNINTKLRIPKGTILPEHEISIAEALMFKLNYKEYQSVMLSLNRKTAEDKLRGTMSSATGEKVIAVQMYDEDTKNKYLKDLQIKLDYIDAHLEILNATTEVV